MIQKHAWTLLDENEQGHATWFIFLISIWVWSLIDFKLLGCVVHGVHDNNLLPFYIVGYCCMKFFTSWSAEQHSQVHSSQVSTFNNLP
jgi:hypothetical protein